VRLPLTICTLIRSESLVLSLQQYLSDERYLLSQYQSKEAFLNFVVQRTQILDCLILEEDSELLSIVNLLYSQGTLLPAVILRKDPKASNESIVLPQSPDLGLRCESGEIRPSEASKIPPNEVTSGEGNFFYHTAAVYVSESLLSEIAHYIDEAISHFLELSSVLPPGESCSISDTTPEENALLEQQRRLAEKLRERLGYLGVYYKRNPQNFFRNLPRAKRQEFLDHLKAEYRQIVLEYFAGSSNLNQRIDEFVNVAFFADISVTYIVEIHMELMDDISKHLKLEGRSDEVLLDYRLTLIDVIAHLCEMYRRSLPKDS